MGGVTALGNDWQSIRPHLEAGRTAIPCATAASQRMPISTWSMRVVRRYIDYIMGKPRAHRCRVPDVQQLCLRRHQYVAHFPSRLTAKPQGVPLRAASAQDLAIGWNNYLKSKTGIMIPIGSTEQHGPTELVGTDALTAEMIARGAGEKVGALVAPTFWSAGGASPGLRGSVTLRPTTLIAVVRDTVVWLARRRFTRFFFVNGHGGNIATVTAAFSEIYSERSMERMSNQPSIKCALRNWWDGPGIRALQKELYPSGEAAMPPPLKSRSPGTNIPRRCSRRRWSPGSRPTAPSPMPRISPRLPGRPYRLGSQPGHARAWQTLLRHRRRGGRARLREVGGALMLGARLQSPLCR